MSEERICRRCGKLGFGVDHVCNPDDVADREVEHAEEAMERAITCCETDYEGELVRGEW